MSSAVKLILTLILFGEVAIASRAQVVPLPADAPTGGIQLDVTPRRSLVYVDGALKGRVDEFRGYFRPLTLTAGVHEIAIIERGYHPLIFTVMVTPGRTQTYRATLDDGLVP